MEAPKAFWASATVASNCLVKSALPSVAMLHVLEVGGRLLGHGLEGRLQAYEFLRVFTASAGLGVVEGLTQGGLGGGQVQLDQFQPQANAL